MLDEDGIWRFYRNGSIDTSKNGMQNVNGYQLLFRDGIFDSTFTGLYNESCYVYNGYLVDWYSGLYQDNTGSIYLLNGGVWDNTYTGDFTGASGTWYIENGVVQYQVP